MMTEPRDRGRGGRSTATGQGTAATPEAEEAARGRLSPGASDEHAANTAQTLLRRCERINVCCFKPPSVWYFAMAAQKQIQGLIYP